MKLGTYQIPRNTKGESRILYIFSPKAMIYTAIGGGLGLLFFFLFNLIGLSLVGIIITLIFAAIGYGIGMLKVPEIPNWEFAKKTGGENVDDVIKRAILFSLKKKRIYTYTKEEQD